MKKNKRLREYLKRGKGVSINKFIRILLNIQLEKAKEIWTEKVIGVAFKNLN